MIAGNASLGRELAAEAERAGRRFAAIVVPVGGGGLSAGVLTGLRAAGDPTPVFAAEPLVANDLAQSLRAGRLVRLAAEPATLADGARTRAVGAHPWAVLERGLAGVLEVPEAAIADAVRLLFDLANLKAEPTGALAVGAVLTGALAPRPGPVCCVVSGGNVDPEVYRTLLRHAGAVRAAPDA